MMTAALEDTLDMLSRFHRHYQRQLDTADTTPQKSTPIAAVGEGSPPLPPPFREIVKSFAKCWLPVSAAICPEGPITPSSLKRLVEEIVDQVSPKR
jgi:hypothetical protein